MNETNQYPKEVVNMAVSMFLGLSLGKWEIVKLPTAEDPGLSLKYGGREKGGRPFKLLNAAARPPKKYRPTVYWQETHVNLKEQLIEFYTLRERVPVSRLIRDLGECFNRAEKILKHRVELAATAPQRQARLEILNLRRSIRVRIKGVLAEEFPGIKFLFRPVYGEGDTMKVQMLKGSSEADILDLVWETPMLPAKEAYVAMIDKIDTYNQVNS